MADTTLTDEEAAQLRRYVQGGKFSGAARRKLMEFAASKGWSDQERKQVVAVVSAPFGAVPLQG